MDADNNPKTERGRRSPGASLEEAIGYLQTIRSELAMGPFGADPLAVALGHKASSSGTAKMKIGSLTHYDLLSREGNVYRVSEVGKRILLPLDADNHRDALVAAAKAPSLYTELIRDHAGKALPPHFGSILAHKYGVLASTAGDVASVFRQTMEYAGLLRHGVLYDAPAATGETSAHAPAGPVIGSHGDATTSPPLASSPERPNSASLDDYRVPLSKGRVAYLRLPKPDPPLRKSDIALIKKMLDLYAPALTGLDDEEVEGE